MKKLVLTKNEKIVAVIMLFWTFISISNYLITYVSPHDKLFNKNV
jgi:hypothetical protein